jgi:hypothetical protein
MNPDVIVGAGAGWLPLVAVYDGKTLMNPTPSLIGGFTLAFGSTFRGGVTVAAGDLNNNGKAEVVVGAGPGAMSWVRVFEFNGTSLAPKSTFLAFPSAVRTGVFVAVGDFDGNGVRDIIVGAGAGWLPQVAVFQGNTLAPISRFLAYDSSYRGGVHVTAKPTDGGNPGFVEKISIWLAPGPNTPRRPVRLATFGVPVAVIDKFFENGFFDGGVFVG